MHICMGKSISIFFAAIVMALALSCQKADSDLEWGTALVYMPQASNNPYVIPGSGSTATYELDQDTRLLKVYLGVYRSGLQPLEEYKVNLYSTQNKIKGTLLLDPKYYFYPLSLTCPDGSRDVPFCLEVNLDYLLQNRKKEFSLEIGIDTPSRYQLNEELSLTTILISVPELVKKENL